MAWPKRLIICVVIDHGQTARDLKILTTYTSTVACSVVLLNRFSEYSKRDANNQIRKDVVDRIVYNVAGSIKNTVPIVGTVTPFK